MKSRLNQISMYHYRLKQIYKQIENCKGVQSQQLWGKVFEIKQKLRSFK